MLELIETKLNLKIDPDLKAEYESCIYDLAQHKTIEALDHFAHHYSVSRLEHCLHVSYLSYLACRKWNLDYRSAARGGLLHDFYFYNSRTTRSDGGIHCFRHPNIALENASRYFHLNNIEKDIIVKHMWPITLRPPKYKEAYVVTLIDKYCASKEVTLYNSKFNLTPLVLAKVSAKVSAKSAVQPAAYTLGLSNAGLAKFEEDQDSEISLKNVV